MSLASQRARSVVLFAAMVICDTCAISLSPGRYQTVVLGLTIAAIVATLGLLMSLFIGKRDWALRGLMLAVTVGWTSVKV
jgi:hypothetical protein